MNKFSIALFPVKKTSSTRLTPNVQKMSKNGSIIYHIISDDYFDLNSPVTSTDYYHLKITQT